MFVRRESVTTHPLQQQNPASIGSNGASPLVPHQIVTRLRKKPVPFEEESIGSHSSLTTTIHTASLIQSAARSILDSIHTPTSTNVSDADHDFHHRQQQQATPTLDSLKKRSIPALPSDDDRKRFVGCLATVLASAYDYDVADEEDETHANKQESLAYLSRREQEHDSEEEDTEEDIFYHSRCDTRDTIANNNNNNSAVINSNNNIETSDSIDDDGDQLYVQHNCSTSFEYGDAADCSFAMAEPQQTQQQRQKNQFTKEKSMRKTALARHRHRKRRYDMLSRLLLSSAELLLLDKSHARAFLPILARVLMPRSASQKANAARMRLQQLQQRQQQKENVKEPQEQQNQKHHASPQRNATCSTVPSSPAALNDQNLRGNETPPKGDDKGINRYHFSPSIGIPLSRTIPLVNEESSDDKCFIPGDMEDEDHLRPFLESLSPGAGYRCLALLLLQHLLTSSDGYDARIRHVIKKLGVIVLVHDMEIERDLELVEEPNVREAQQRMMETSKRRSRMKTTNRDDTVAAATRKFEALEHAIAVRLIRLSKEQQRQQGRTSNRQQQQYRRTRRRQRDAAMESSSHAISREQFVRGLKIGSAGLVAGTIFAVTGGLAAPGIAAGVAAIAGSTAATAAVAAIVSSTPAVTAIFGVGGGSLAAYKMNRRTQGLTEFEFRRHDRQFEDRVYDQDDKEEMQAELFSTVCISGWLRDQHDFQRPWGVAPSNPRIKDRLELLERFYVVYRPDHVCKCKKILASWKGEEKQLWELLKQKYGRDPDHLYPIAAATADESGFIRGLTLEQEEVLSDLFVELGYTSRNSDDGKGDGIDPPPTSAFERFRHTFAQAKSKTRLQSTTKQGVSPLDVSIHGPTGTDGLSCPSSGFDSVTSSKVSSGASSTSKEQDAESKEQNVPPKHVSTVWDYHSRYQGELYTVKWESEMLIELCDSVTDLAFDVINSATAQLLRQTALSTLLSAVAIPYALVNAAHMIDGIWILAVERADEAGRELARSLLCSRAGHRPITLVGFSFGARAIYSCLKELAKQQEKWEASREHSRSNGAEDVNHNSWVSREPASIVEDVILMGLPNHLSLSSWRACRQIVGGRLVNCYSRKDLILSLMFQIKRLAGGLKPVCGTCPVDIPGVENVDVSDLITSHQDYCLVTGEILKRVRHGQPFRAPSNPFTNVAMIEA